MAKLPPPTLRQPPLRSLEPGERIVRTGGLKFILPTPWSAGMVLDEQAAAFLTSAWHTAILNRFNSTGFLDSLYSTQGVTYDDIDAALQDFALHFTYTPRPPKDDSAEPPPTTDPTTKAFLSFCRARWSAVMSGKGIPRDQYEEGLVVWIGTNRSYLETEFAKENSAMEELGSLLSNLLSTQDLDQSTKETTP